MDSTKLTKIALEKKALFNPVKYLASLPGAYKKNIMEKLVNPAKAEGWGKAISDYVGGQFIPKGYVSSLAEKSKSLRGELDELAGMANKTDDMLARQKEIPQELAKLQERMVTPTQLQAYQRTGVMPLPEESLFKSRMRTLMHSPTNKWEAFKELGRMGGHYGLEGLNSAFMWGFPAYGAYQVATSPEGERAKMLGGLMGDLTGFVAGGPIGLLPTLAGSHALSALGHDVGGSIGEAVSPTPWYKQLANKMSPEQKQQLNEVLPRLIRGGLLAPKHLGAMSMPNYQRNLGQNLSQY